MKNNFYITAIMIIASLFLMDAMGQSDRDGARSVVKIETEFPVTDKHGRPATGTGNGTGWCYNNSYTVITALHVVAGIPDGKITVITDEKKKKSGAKVVRVFKEADLAMLQLTSDLGLVPLPIEPVNPNSRGEYSIWGFQHNVFQMGDAEVKLSRTLSSNPTLDGLINSSDLKFLLDTKQGYPLSRAKILRVSSPLRPGHSGAPIFTSSGKVIGIADGGLHEGIAGLNWAIPASEYVPKLLASQEGNPKNRSITEELKGSSTIVPIEASEEERDQIMEQSAASSTITNGNQSITKSWTASYKDIMATMSGEGKDDILEIVNEYKLNMNDTWYDIYENYETGATFAIPAGTDLIVENGWFVSSNGEGSVAYMANSYNTESYAGAKEEIKAIYQRATASTTWVMDPDTPDEEEEFDDEEMALYEVMRISDDGENTMMIFHAEIDGPSILVVALIVDANQMENADYLKQVVQYGVAGEMSAFAGY